MCPQLCFSDTMDQYVWQKKGWRNMHVNNMTLHEHPPKGVEVSYLDRLEMTANIRCRDGDVVGSRCSQFEYQMKNFYMAGMRTLELFPDHQKIPLPAYSDIDDVWRSRRRSTLSTRTLVSIGWRCIEEMVGLSEPDEVFSGCFPVVGQHHSTTSACKEVQS
jgi:hypothetical protein